ncbi:LacI family DNA-binding transcriptional regulator [Herbiconiux sp. KACC 21604]|uniref:LacI family DNA-binding transcriptional regulator n=1 Tax=unclassified Herbiconiux TaxID=2618217 RepID=UPI0020A3FB2F|nr:LacI family DNA-binding transcriptional regulator [Herbiconiux sp. SALV-R1]WPO86816.1 LacI family DNA-binding transcriptional regulator [Herbiconiux sp. KACC 21604]
MKRSESRPPTVKEVAARAGVSPMTVSRTLGGGVNVRPEIQERVLAAVEELGYRRNENARSLRPGQPSGLIGVAITNLANPYYGNFALGVEEIATEHGRRILLGNTGESIGRERQLVADFVGRQVEGLVLVPSGGAYDHLSRERLGDAPLVLASRRVDGLHADVVVLDDVGGAYSGTMKLLREGHTRIAYLGNVLSVITGQRRFDGFQRALDEKGVTLAPELIRRSQQDVESARIATEELFDLADPPTAIFCANNRNTIGALQEIGRRSMAGRREFPSIVSFDDFELAELMPVPVTVLHHDARELGRVAGRLLFERLGGDTGPARTIELPVSLRVARA